MTETEKNIETIEHVFQNVRQEVFRNPDTASNSEWIQFLNSPFYSIAYEAASFELANLDFIQNNNLAVWRYFMKNSDLLHQIHILYGLGWAIATHAPKPFSYIESNFKPYEFELADGMGYFYALYKPASVFGTRQNIPDLPENVLSNFYTGVGRRIFYLDKGIPELMADKINAFPSNCHQGLWQGVGIASEYVGNPSDQQKTELETLSGIYVNQLKAGQQLVRLYKTELNNLVKRKNTEKQTTNALP